MSGYINTQTLKVIGDRYRENQKGVGSVKVRIGIGQRKKWAQGELAKRSGNILRRKNEQKNPYLP